MGKRQKMSDHKKNKKQGRKRKGKNKKLAKVDVAERYISLVQKEFLVLEE